MSSLNPAIAGVDFTSIAAVAEFTPGTIALSPTGTLYQYVKAGATAPVQYDAYAISSAFVLNATGVTYATMGSGANPTKLGVPQQSGWVANYFGWVAIKGVLTFSTSEAVDAGDKIYSSGTAGKLGDTSTTQSLIAGLTVLTTTGAAGTASGNAIHELSANCFS